MKRLLLILILSAAFTPAFAHSDWIIPSNHGLVHTAITTGFRYEEIRKMEILGHLADTLSDMLGSKTKIFLDYKHTYTQLDYAPKYRVGFGSEEYFDKETEEYKDAEGLVIKIFAPKLDFATVLKLVEFGIKKEKYVKENQVDLLYRNRPYKGLHPDNSRIDSVIKQQSSKAVLEALKCKVYRPLKNDEDPDISYFYLNGKYYVFKINFVSEGGKHFDKEIVVKEFDDIYQFSVVRNSHALIFDTYNSFYFIDGVRNNHRYDPREEVSRRQIIDVDYEWHYPYDIYPVGGDRISIVINDTSNKPFRTYYDEPDKYWKMGLGAKEYNMIYIVNNDVLLQNADEILDEAAMKQLGIVHSPKVTQQSEW